MNETGWYFAESGQQVGPVSKQEMLDHLRSGRITAETLVWHSSLTNWTPLSQSELRPPPATQSLPPVYPGRPDPVRTSGEAYGGPGSGSGFHPAGSRRGVPFGEAISLFWQNFATFSGRATRSEYWYAVLFLAIAGTVTALIDLLIVGQGAGGVFPVNTVFQLAAFIPSLAVAFRRLHDTDRTGWWLLLVFVPLGFIVLIVFLCQKGTDGPNRYGA